ncbi:disease resistance protein RPV1-like [Eucalyptus grandis]|uniref:disease resistance protein RPV1-like n=1 Tax=Eucalyptus grandis TaxID=71139 RepID=UPI00192F075D|nr:disease resistance protein RPV1-like [Eucalyptus grandis]
MKELKWLHWEYHPSPFDGNNFHVKELRVLKLWGEISDKWQGWSSITMAKKLKYLNLANCRSLEGTSFLSAFENLEVLILHGCEELKQIDSSIGNMRSLECLDLTGCDLLEGLPAEVGKLKTLKQLILHWTFISSLPDSIWALQNLEILDIQAAQIENLPESVGALHNLIILNISQTNIKKLPNGIRTLRKLQYLSAANCEKLEEEIPEGIYNLSSLHHLDLSFCYKLPSLSVLPSSLKYLSITCKSRRLSSLSNLTHLKKLRLLDCESLECFGEHPSALLEKSVNTPFELEILIIVRCRRMETLDVSQFNHLRRLQVEDCDKVLEIRGLNKLEYLESLEIAASKSPKACSIERLDLPMCKKLRIFEAKSCINLIEIQGLDKLGSLEGIDISGSTSIVKLDLPKSKDMKIFNVKDCVRLVEIQGLDRWESLKGIDISGCTSIIRLDLPKSEGMKIINAKNCKNLVEIQGLNRLESLEEMDISGCESLEEIDISGCSSIVRLSLPKSDGLKILGDTNCQKLVNIQAQNSLQRTEHFAKYFIQGLGRPMFEDLRELYGGLYKSLYGV